MKAPRIIRPFFPFVLAIGLFGFGRPVLAAPARPSISDWNDLFRIVTGLEVNPKFLTTPDGDRTTFGIEYKFQREIRPRALSLFGDSAELGISLRSEGLIVAGAEAPPNRLIEHGLRISALDLLPSRWTTNQAALEENARLRDRVDRQYFQRWKADAEELRELRPETDAPRIAQLQSEMEQLAAAGALELKEYGTLKPDPVSRLWWLQTSRGLRDWGSQVAGKVVKERFVFLNFDLDASLEHDQALTNVQFFGGAQIRGKLLVPQLDWPFQLLRLGGDIQDHLNRNGGPYFNGGIGMVDAGQNEARLALTTEHQQFLRAHFGLFYRTELISISDSKSVALELQWRYYHEFDPPAPVRARKLDSASYFKATVLLPGDYFLAFTDGKLPLDLEGASTVSAGWRHNF